MSGGLGSHLNPFKNISSVLHAHSLKDLGKSSFVSPLHIDDKLKKIGGSIMGTRAARQAAQAQQQQAEQQEQQYQATLQQTQNQNTLDSSADTSNVATVTAGGTAQDSDDALNTATKKNRQQLISQTLGL